MTAKNKVRTVAEQSKEVGDKPINELNQDSKTKPMSKEMQDVLRSHPILDRLTDDQSDYAQMIAEEKANLSQIETTIKDLLDLHQTWLKAQDLSNDRLNFLQAHLKKVNSSIMEYQEDLIEGENSSNA